MSKKNKKKLENALDNERNNALSDLVSGLYGSNLHNVTQVSKSDTFYINTSYDLIFYDRSMLSQVYVKHGIVQTLVEQPVLDALRGGVDIIAGELDKDEIIQLQNYMDRESIWKKICDTLTWGRLFGGSGLVIKTDQKTDTPFEIEKITEDSKLDFYAADLWELNMLHYTNNPNIELKQETPYMFYGLPLHKSRVIKFKGKEAPSFVRPRLRGWGMSEVERLIRSMNQYFKNQDVIFELLDEAKVDIYKIEGLNTALMSAQGSEKVTTRIQLANQLKNYLNALTMDVKDDYDQKNMTFSGLGEMLTQIRQGIASDLKMPMTKLFGISSAGFNSGEDDIENYNAMVESEVRAKCKYMIINVMEILCQKLFGYIPEDLNIEFKPLRILSSEQDQNVKNAKLNRIMSAFSSGIIDSKTAKEAINKDNLLSIELKENDDIFENPTMTSEVPSVAQ